MKAFFSLGDNCSKVQIRQSDKLTKGNRKYLLIQWLMKNHLQLFPMDSSQNNVFRKLKNTLNLFSTGVGL